MSGLDETFYAATNKECCEEMADRHNWSLNRVEPTSNDILSVDCVFDGYCEFPQSRMDRTQSDDSKED
ncbi:MAG: hypothetical protein B0A82_20495 [Alkalinema sp. CACIAM 70d]|nr:MAG: hypothetical protein B0A82_20495 [Alkalinema sp. CACIAM 70d]